MSISLHPLSSSDRAAGWTDTLQDAWRNRVTPFIDSGVLTPAVVQVVDLLGRRAGETDPDVLLGLALAVRAPLHGHVRATLPNEAVDTEAERLPVPDDPDTTLPWPAARDAWRQSVQNSPLVAAPSSRPDRPFVLWHHALYPHRTWSDEHRLAGLLTERARTRTAPASAALLKQGLHALFPAPVPSAPLDRQLLAAALACLRGFSIISGGPGTGKTWTVRNVLTLLFAQHLASGSNQPFRVAVGAPTGKAAARVQESLTSGLAEFVQERGQHALPPGTPPDALLQFLETLAARTVHRLLRVDPRNPGRFRHGPGHPLPVDLVLIDETSMLDLALMTRLVEAVPPGARLVLLGDHHQLASVDAGCVLADLCRAARFDAPRLSTAVQHDLLTDAGLTPGPDISTTSEPGLYDCGVQLTVSRRFTADSGIGAVARTILSGDGPAGRTVLQSPRFGDVAWSPLGEDGGPTRAFAKLIVDGYGPVLSRLLAGPRGVPERDFHQQLLTHFDHFRLLCAHRNGRLGVHGLVELTEGLLSRKIRGFRPRGPTYIGRPVLVTRNDYGVGRYNGDIGLIVTRDGRPTVAFPDPTSGVAYLSPARLPPHETVFAMTIHKSQGSEFHHAAVVLPSRPSPILTRELIYTGATRAKRRLTVVGTAEVWDLGVERRVARATGLAERLVGTDPTG